MKLPELPSIADVQSLLRQEYRVSWAGLSSPLRTKSDSTTSLRYRHTPMTEVWRLQDASPCSAKN